jgi:ferredoxin-NADP reductase
MTVIETPAMSVTRLKWRLAEVRKIVVETPRVKSLLLHVPSWKGHLPGQHVDIRLTAEDGYQAQRSYSIASPPEDKLLTLTVERVDNGEVSQYLVYFVWTTSMGGPLCLVAGSGVAPLMAMLRYRGRRNAHTPALLLYSSRSLEDVIYRDELDSMAHRDSDLRVVNTLTRKQPEGWIGHRRRIDKELLAETFFPPKWNPKVFVCGPTPFVENISRFLVALDMTPSRSRRNALAPQEDRDHD